MAYPRRILAFVMAGGRGERLDPLTRYRTKPAVPFGARYRIIDFVLSNLVNSGIHAIYVLTQYKAQSVLEHIQMGWMNQVAGRDNFIHAVPAQMQLGQGWYRGTSDAVFQNMNLLQQYDPDVVVIFAADHVYKMNIRQMVEFHLEAGSKATVACLPVPREEATSFGVVGVDRKYRVTSFLEKPADPPGMPGKPDTSYVSMGNYVFDPKVLVESLRADDADADSQHDFGRNIFPNLAEASQAYAYDFSKNRIPGRAHESEMASWKDLGTIDSYFEANLDLKNVRPQLNLYNWKWPILTSNYNDPPAKFVFDDTGRRGMAVQSVVSPGCILAGGYIKDSVLGRNVFLDEGSDVRDSIILDNVYIGPGCRIRNTIIDKNVRIEAGEAVGYDAKFDRKRYFVSESGIVVVPKSPETRETRARRF
ncbi:MAG: glucose-1-phosphate adenylyltransferase [Anaerolineales bacterium]